MINEYKALFDVFQKGKEVKNAAAVKNYHLMGSALAGLLGSALVIAQASGYYIPISKEDIAQVGVGIASLWEFGSVILTVISSKKVGLPPPE